MERRRRNFFRSPLDLPERRFVESHATVIVPFDDRVFFVRSFHGAEFSRRLSKVSQTLDAVSWIHLRARVDGLGECGSFGAVGFGCRAGVRQGRLRSPTQFRCRFVSGRLHISGDSPEGKLTGAASARILSLNSA